MATKKQLTLTTIALGSILFCNFRAEDAGFAEGSEPFEVLYVKAEQGNETARQKFAEAMDMLSARAKQGDAEAQYQLGCCYLLSPQVDGSKVDFVKVAEWFTKSAEQGYAQAQYHLGLFYLGGTGVERDVAKGIEWLAKSAAQGDDNAQYILGVLYLRGDNSAYDEASIIIQAIVEAANQGNTQAKFAVGLTFLMGSDNLETERDATVAFKWFRKSAEQGNTHTQRIIGMCYEKGIGTTKDIDEANKWYAKATGRQADETEKIAEAEPDKGTIGQKVSEETPPPSMPDNTSMTNEGEKQHRYRLYAIVGLFAAFVIGAMAWKATNHK